MFGHWLVQKIASLWHQVWGRLYCLIVDLMVLAVAFNLAYMFRFDFSMTEAEVRAATLQMTYTLPIEMAVLIGAGIYKFIWRYVGVRELKPFINTVLLASLPLLLLRLLLPVELNAWRIPLSIISMNGIFAFGGLLGVRLLRRLQYEHAKKRKQSTHAVSVKKPVLLIGAGRAGVLASSEILSRGDSDLEIKGFVDDDPKKTGSVINGVQILGTTQNLERLVKEHGIDHVIISIAQASRREFRRLLDICEQIPVKVRTIPSLLEIMQGRVAMSRVRDVQIEDLLGRAPVQLDEKNIREFLSGKAVMVTGAGGSIGSELSRQVLFYKPACVLLVERAEFALFNIERELSENWPDCRIVPLIADICDEARMESIFATYHPQVVFHAAAHKHVPMMEVNAHEAIKNNVLGTRLLGELCGQHDVEVMVFISTDKAVRPTSVMGASKRVAELVVQKLNREFQTRYVAVRFGNVIGSAGSVIPIFREQISHGGPVTVTHPDMKRYFMTIPEATQLVLQASAMGEGGEIFILDMGEPVRILDLAKETITLSGLRPHEDIEIVFHGLRPGEKLFEELEVTGEKMTKTRHPKIFIGKIAEAPQEAVQAAIERLAALSRNGNERRLRLYLNELLPEARLELNPEMSMAAIATSQTFRLAQPSA